MQQSKAKQSSAEQSRAVRQSKAKQSKAEQSKAKQSTAEQCSSAAKQSRAEQQSKASQCNAATRAQSHTHTHTHQQTHCFEVPRISQRDGVDDKEDNAQTESDLCLCDELSFTHNSAHHHNMYRQTVSVQIDMDKNTARMMTNDDDYEYKYVSLSMKFQASRFSASGREMPLEPHRSEACRSCQPMHVLSFGEGRKLFFVVVLLGFPLRAFGV